MSWLVRTALNVAAFLFLAAVTVMVFAAGYGFFGAAFSGH